MTKPRIVPVVSSGDLTRDYRRIAEAINILVEADTSGNQLADLSNYDIAALGWTLTSVFSATDADTVEWTSGTFTTAGGDSYSINAGNTGTMSARTYIYLDINTSETALQTSATASAAVGAGKVLIGVAENAADEAFFQIFGGIGGTLLTANEIAVNAITTNSIAAGAVTASKITVANLAAINANMGSITAGNITLSEFIRAGQTSYNNGIGFYMEYNGGTPRFSIGNSAGNRVTWDGSTLTVEGTVGGVLDATDLSGIVPIASNNIAVQGWSVTNIFSATDADTVAWSSGSFIRADGTTYSIGAGNTGNMTARTYIYLDINVSTTAYQTTTTASTAIGTGKVLIGVAEDDASTAFFQIFGGIGGINGIQFGTLNSILVNLDTQVSGTLSTAFAEAGLINTNVTVNADGTLTGAGGGQVSLTSLPGQVQVGSIAANAVTTGTIAALAVTAAKIDALAVETGKIAANAVTAAKIAANTITANEIASNTITTNQIAANTIVAGNIASATITTTQIAANTILGGNISSLSISGKTLTADTGTVGGWTLASGSLSSGSFTINSTNEEMEIGSATAPLTGVGIWLGKDGSDYEFRAGDPSGDYIHWDGSLLTVVGDVKFGSVQTFTPSSWTGFSSAPSGDISYIDLGTHVLLWYAGGSPLTGTSNANTHALNGLPAAIQPANQRLMYTFALDNGAHRHAVAIISGGGSAIQFQAGTVSGNTVSYSATGWTTSGTKGITNGWMMFYAK